MLEPTLQPWIRAAISKDHRMSVEAVWAALLSSAMQAFVAWVPSTNELIALLLTEVIDHPRVRCFTCAYVAANKPPKLWLHLLAELEAYAIEAGASEIELHHRLAPEYRRHHRVFVKELVNG